MTWRNMTGQELATRPEARLGGALLWVVLAAAVVCILAIGGALLAGCDPMPIIAVAFRRPEPL